MIRWKKILITTGILFTVIILAMPIPDDEPSFSASLYSSDGQLLSAVVSKDEQWCLPLQSELPEKIATCITMFEDEYFYYHPGINPISIVKAILVNVKEKQIVRGGSTITMQVMRMKNGHAVRNIQNKVYETLSALKYSLFYSKNYVLKEWANTAPFGGNTIGIQAAALRYFSRPLDKLSWSECALLAVLPNAPSTINLEKNRNELKHKRNLLLDKLSSKNAFPKEDLQLYKDENVPDFLNAIPQKAYHALTYFAAESKSNQIHSTLNYELQSKLNEIIATETDIMKLDGIEHSAALIIDVETKEVLAYVGNTPGPSAFNYIDLAQAHRSYGSLLKPFLYATALDEHQYLPHELTEDIPTQIEDFRPENFDKKFRGAVPLDAIITQSLNVPAVRVLQNIGVHKFYKNLDQLEIDGLDRGADHYGLSLILGGGETSLWELARLYCGLARNYLGLKNPYESVQWNLAEESKEKSIDFQFSPFAIFKTVEAMSDLTRPREQKSWPLFDRSLKIAWKTGTSYGHKDAWAIGFNGKYVVAVWVGNASGEGRPQLTGLSRAAPTLFKIFNSLPDNSWFDRMPSRSGSDIVTVCKESGKLAGRLCRFTQKQALDFLSHAYQTCIFHSEVLVNSEGLALDPNCKQMAFKKDTFFTLPPLLEYYYKPGHTEYTGIPPSDPLCKQTKERPKFVYPSANLKLYLPKLSDSLTHGFVANVYQPVESPLFWYVDGKYSGKTEYKSEHQLALVLDKGKHLISVYDSWGNGDEVHFEVLDRN